VTVVQANSGFRRLAVLAAIALVIGVSAHGLCQALEHHYGADDAAALCVVVMAILAVVALAGGRCRREVPTPSTWSSVPQPIPAGAQTVPAQASPAWLQRFLN
jgi:hypothetical protein